MGRAARRRPAQAAAGLVRGLDRVNRLEGKCRRLAAELAARRREEGAAAREMAARSA